MTRLHARAGFSLIEVMIVLVIMGVLTAQMFMAFASQKQAYLKSDRALDMQEGARLITDLVAHDTRMAGFMLPLAAAVSSFDGGNAAPDRLCISESDYFSTPLDGTLSPLDNMISPFPGSSVTSATGTAIVLPITDLDVDGDGDVDFFGPDPGLQNGAGIILADGLKTHCARIAQIVGGNITLAAGHGVPGGHFVSFGNVVAVPAIIYETGVAPATTLMRNGMVLSNDVEDFQVEFWVDSQVPDNLLAGTEFPVFDLNTAPGGWVIDLERIRRVQVSVVTLSDRGDSTESENFSRYRRPAVANRAAGPYDNFPRRRFTVNVLPRNLIREDS